MLEQYVNTTNIPLIAYATIYIQLITSIF